MKRNQIARRLAREKRLAPSAAQDQIDEIVHNMLNRLRKGKPVDLPGLGKLVPKKTR